jgi:hypothetical protein
MHKRKIMGIQNMVEDMHQQKTQTFQEGGSVIRKKRMTGDDPYELMLLQQKPLKLLQVFVRQEKSRHLPSANKRLVRLIA